MTDRDSLITKIMSLNKPTISLQTAMDIVDAIIDEGVIVPPCNCAECKHLKIVDKTPIFAECSNPKVIRKFLYFEEDTRKASCEYAEAKLKECDT